MASPACRSTPVCPEGSFGVVKRLLFVRHAQSEANVTGCLDSSVPGPALSAEGERQATGFAERFGADGPVRGIWTSSMRRAQQTGAALAERLGHPVDVRDGLKELGVGDLHSRVDDEAHQLLDDLMASWLVGGALDNRRPGGESGLQIVERFGMVLDEVLSSFDDGTAVLVSHGGAIRLSMVHLCQGVSGVFALANHLPNTGAVTVDVDADTLWVRDWAGQPPL